MKFSVAILKLTSFYVLVTMIISIGFSVAIYRISSNEIDHGLGSQSMMLHNLPRRIDISILDDLENLRQDQISESLDRLQKNLAYFNLLIFLLSAVGGYFFARWTLRPLEEAVEEQNRFTADASHELRTPLSAIKSEIEVNLRDKNLSIKDARKLLNSNLEEIEKLQDLSAALLKLSKFDEFERMSFSTINLDETVTAAYEKTESLAGVRNIEFEAKLVKAKVLGDKDSLVELFVILFENAIKYSPKNSKIIVKIVKEGKSYLVKVKDRGVGLKSSEIPHIFDRFYRADQSRNKDKADGYGLGLSIAKRIIDLHQGKIFVHSTPGKGSEFIVKL